MSFRPGGAGNFNFYGYYGRIGYAEHAGKPGGLINPGNFASPLAAWRSQGTLRTPGRQRYSARN
jgi:hypothetical protein